MNVLVCSNCANPEAYHYEFCPLCGCDAIDNLTAKTYVTDHKTCVHRKLPI